MKPHEKTLLCMRIGQDAEYKYIGPDLVSRFLYGRHVFLHRSRPTSYGHAWDMGIDVVNWILKTMEGNNAN